MAAVHRFDLSVLPQDHVDILIPIVPTDEEVEQFKEHAARNNGSYDGLSVEDQFMAQLMNIERLAHKLKIMSFMAGFEESVRLIEPVSRISVFVQTGNLATQKHHRRVQVHRRSDSIP